MRDATCYLCGADNGRRLFSQSTDDPYLALVFDRPPERSLDWLVCQECGFVYRSPVLDEDELHTLYERYEQDVFKGTDPDAYFDRIVSLPREESENWAKADWLARAARSLGVRPKPDVLDIGCGGGTLLHVLGERMPLGRVCGVELNPAYAELAARRMNADIRNEAYVGGAFGIRFDLLVCTKVLEHVPDPLPFLSEMRSDLAGDGALFLEVPNVSDLYVLPPDNERFYIPHIYFFSAATLGALLAKAGLEVCESRVVTTHRGRAYLQILASGGRSVRVPGPPYNDPGRVAELTVENIHRHAQGEKRHG